MPRVQIDATERREDSSQFPRLKLDKGEFARILMIEPTPWSEYTHSLRMPKVLNGRAVMVKKKRQNGEEYEDYDMDFIGRPICLGDQGILADRGSDPANCPACKAAATGDQVQKPERRFAAHILKYSCKPGTTEIATPFSVQLLAWSFNEKMFTRLIGFKEEHGNLQQRDLLVECTNKMYQNFEVNVSGKAEWLLSEDRKSLAKETYASNKLTDDQLAEQCGRRVQKAWLIDDLEKISGRWAIINGNAASRPDASAALDGPSLAEGLDDLLTSQTGGDSSSADLGIDMFDVAATEDTPAAKSEPNPKPGSSGESISFDDLLG